MKEREADEGGVCEINGRCPNENEIYCPTLNGGECWMLIDEEGFPAMDACYSCPNATGVYTKLTQFSSDGSAFLSSSTNIETNYHMCTEANETFCSSMWGNHYNFCPTDKSCKEANNEGCSYCPKNTFDPPGFLGGYFSGVGGEWTDDKKSCLTAQDVDGTYACGSDPNGKYYCNANGDGKCMDLHSCSEFQYDETLEAKENVFKHIDGKKYVQKHPRC